MRYIISVMAPLFVGLLAYIVATGTALLRSFLSKCHYRIGQLVLLILLGGMLVRSYQHGVPMLFRNNLQQLATLAPYRDLPLLYLYNVRWRIIANLPALQPMQRIIFLDRATWNTNKTTDYHTPALLVCVAGELSVDHQYLLATIIANNHLANAHYQKLLTLNYATTVYYVTGQVTGRLDK